jgi:hypothetical protein
LNPLARALFLFDLALLRRIWVVERKYASSADEVRKNEAVRRIDEIDEVHSQWEMIDSGENQFSLSYVQSKHFIPIWVEGLGIVKEALRFDNMSSNHVKKRLDYMDIVTRYEQLAYGLRERLVDTARQGLLKNEILFSIQERWIRLDELLDWYYNTYNEHRDEDTPYMSRSAPTWLV